jgi:hypothetical protein
MFVEGIPARGDNGIKAVVSSGSVFVIVREWLSHMVGCPRSIAHGNADFDEHLNLKPRQFIPPPWNRRTVELIWTFQ